MPKRLRQETDEERWRRKMKEYENRLARSKRRRIIYSSSSDNEQFEQDVQPQEHLNDEIMEIINTSDPESVREDHESNVEHDRQPSTSTTPVDQAVPATTSNEAPPPPEQPLVVDPDLLRALGDFHSDISEWGENILQDISQRWEPLFKDGLKKEVKDDLFKKYPYPKNAPLSKPPVLNPEVSSVITEACRNRDSRICAKQRQLGHAISALGKAMTGILTKNMETPQIITILNDAGRLIADSHFLETDTRRSLITPMLDKTYVTPFKDRKRDSFLFGENLGDFIKSSRGIKKTGQLITPPAASTPSSSSANLNWRGPPRQPRTSRFQASRGGGQRAYPPTQRRAPPPPPPPPRRAPAPAASRRPAPPSTYRSRNTT